MSHELFTLAPRGHSHTSPSAEDAEGTCTHSDYSKATQEAVMVQAYGTLTLCHPWAKLAFINHFIFTTALISKGY